MVILKVFKKIFKSDVIFSWPVIVSFFYKLKETESEQLKVKTFRRKTC